MIEGTFATASGNTLRASIPDETVFEQLRNELADPIWLLGATWQILTTNDYKRGRFADALGAWTESQSDADVRGTFERAGVTVTDVTGGA